MAYQIYLILDPERKPIYCGRVDTDRPSSYATRDRAISKMQELFGSVTFQDEELTESLSEANKIIKRHQWAHKITATVKAAPTRANGMSIRFRSKANTKLALFGDGAPDNVHVQFKDIAGTYLVVKCNK